MKIFIDPGHNYSGADTGAAGNGLREQDVSYFVGSYLTKYLSDAGFDVKCSRNKLADNVAATFNRSINYRYMQANEFKADYFISLHCDASADKDAKGAHVCVYSKNSTAERLASAVIKKLIPLGLDGRSEKITERKNLGVLKHTNMPAILIEMGFITNPENANLMRSPEVIARAIFEGICEFTGVAVKSESFKYEKIGTTHIVYADPLKLGCIIADRKASDINIANFVNGSYFMNQADGTTFCQHILVDSGKVLSNYPTHGKAVTTLCVFYDGAVQIKKISDVTKERGLKFAISGAGFDDYKAEGFAGKFSDIARKTARTYIGYRKKDNKIVICVRPATEISRAKETFKNLGVDSGLTLDGGGSVCMRVNGDWKVKTDRQINSVVMWE